MSFLQNLAQTWFPDLLSTVFPRFFARLSEQVALQWTQVSNLSGTRPFDCVQAGSDCYEAIVLGSSDSSGKQLHRLSTPTQCLTSGGLPKPRTNSGRPAGLPRQRSRRRSPAPVAPTPKSQPVFGFLRRLDRVIPTTTNKPTASDGSPMTRSWPLFAKLFGQTRLLLGGPSSSV